MAQELTHASGIDFTSTHHRDTYPYISPSNTNLTGKSVLITGASRGIGKEIALSYARAGASKIALAARSPLTSLEPEIQSAAHLANRSTPPQILSLVLDVMSASSVASAAATVEAEFGRLDILVNNAGNLEPWRPIAESEPETWWRTWEVNVRGPYLLTRAFIPLLLATENGLKTVLNVASIGAHVLTPGASAYQTGKLALLRLSEFVDVEYGPKGILVLSVHPGGVVTELARNMPEALHAQLTEEPALAADTIVWLTRERREWLAARYVDVTWDMQELEGRRTEIEERNLLKVRLAID